MEELKAIIGSIQFLPDWATIVSLNLLGIYIILNLVYLILKKMQTQELLAAMSALKDLSGEALRKAGRSLELPIERPRLALVALVLNTALYYVFSLIIFTWFGVFLMLSATTEDMIFTKRILGFCIAGIFMIISRWYFASAERERVALVERWKNLR